MRPCSPIIDLGFDPLILTDATNVKDNGTMEPTTPWDREKDGLRTLVLTSTTCDRIVDLGAWEECFPGDVDGNGTVDISDLTQLLSCFGVLDCTSAPPCCIADIAPTGAQCWDGVIDINDLALLLSKFGLSCPTAIPECSGFGENGMYGNASTSGPTDPLSEWLRSASPEEVLDWWFAGQPPVGGDDR